MKTLEELQQMQAELNAQIALALEQANQLKKKQEQARQAEITEGINKIARAMNQYRLGPAHIFKYQTAPVGFAYHRTQGRQIDNSVAQTQHYFG